MGDSSGLLESIAVGLFCIVALTAIYRKDGATPIRHAEHVAIASRPAAIPVHPVDAGIEAAIKEMRLHD
jgi:hypothetical protein